MEGLLISKRAELAELEKKLALEKEQLNLDVAKSIFADENVAFYKKLHAFFTTRVTEVKVYCDSIHVAIDGNDSNNNLTFEREDEGNYEGEWHLRLEMDAQSIILENSRGEMIVNASSFFDYIGVRTDLENCIFLGAFEAFIAKHLIECKHPKFTLEMFEQKWRK